MVGGQMLDIEAETKGFASLSDISALQRMKTGALFEFACATGPMMAGADQAALKSYANAIGIAFQIADDILDVQSSAEALGKATQKDSAKGKATFIDFLGLEGARHEALRLVDQAKSALQAYGNAADTLRAAADFMITRRK
jgi:farnesyl diphosphate synthase